jgi:hypothetical protein
MESNCPSILLLKSCVIISVYVCDSARMSSRRFCMSALSSSLRVWAPAVMASFTSVEISPLVAGCCFGAAVAFSRVSTVLASAVLRSLKPHSYNASSDGAAIPSKLLGCGSKRTYLLCSLWIFWTNFL